MTKAGGVPRSPAPSRRPHLSLIIPAFNEEARLGPTLDAVLEFLRSRPYPCEVIVVDDGSRDGTAELVRARSLTNGAVRLHRLPTNRGKGEAVRQGMLLGKGAYLFFSDADLSVPIETLPLLLSHLERGVDLAVGSRQVAGAAVEIHQPRHREMMGKLYTHLSNWILGLQMNDLTCGFKGFRQSAARDIFSRQRLTAWSFDAEILYLARRRGYRVLELPVRWRNDPKTKVRLWRDALTSLVGLLTIRLNGRLGRYA